MSRGFNTVLAHFGTATLPGRIEALEGGRGLMRVSLELDGGALPAEGAEGVLEMHDGARFRVAVRERLEGGAGEYRLQLLGRA